jgi:hypothetical protein
MKRLVAVPALLTLAVTLLRLVGELNDWSPRLFDKAAGGGMAIIGIVWLVPVFGLYFAVRLIQSGQGPASRGRAIGFVVAGIVVFGVLGTAIARSGIGGLANIVLFNVMALLAAFVATRGWIRLGQVLLVYGIAARVPVAIIALVALCARWGTHYEKGPGGIPVMHTFATWLAIGFAPQMFFWVAFTVIVGGVFGSLAALAIRPRG